MRRCCCFGGGSGDDACLLQHTLTLICSGARAFALWIANAFKLLADPPTHSADFPVEVCREALQFVHARLWCSDVLDLMGASSSSSSGGGGSSSGSGSSGSSSIIGNIFNSGLLNTSSPSTAPNPTALPTPSSTSIDSSCATLHTACTGESRIVITVCSSSSSSPPPVFPLYSLQRICGPRSHILHSPLMWPLPPPPVNAFPLTLPPPPLPSPAPF